MLRQLSLTTALACALLSTACAPGIRVTRLQPSRFNLGATKKVAILDVRGIPAGAAVLTNELQKQIVNHRYYTLINALNRGLTISVASAGGRVDVAPVRQQVDADVYVLADVTRWDLAERESVEERTEQGKKRTVTMIRPAADVRVSFRVVKADGAIVVFQDYSGSHVATGFESTKRTRYNPMDVFEPALRDTVGRFLGDITPRQVTEKIELDDSDSALKPGIEAAEDGDLAGAERAWDEVLQANPDNAGAQYNLGVLYETRGDFDRAAAAYQRAYQINPKGIYRDAIEALNRRLADAEALQQRL